MSRKQFVAKMLMLVDENAKDTTEKKLAALILKWFQDEFETVEPFGIIERLSSGKFSDVLTVSAIGEDGLRNEVGPEEFDVMIPIGDGHHFEGLCDWIGVAYEREDLSSYQRFIIRSQETSILKLFDNLKWQMLYIVKTASENPGGCWSDMFSTIGICPSCFQTGEVEEGCPNCPGFWFSKDIVDLSEYEL